MFNSLPNHIDSDKVINRILPSKDVDGFHPENAGLLSIGKPRFIPCTPKGIMEILKYYKIKLDGKHVVVVGRSNIVGRPISILTSLKVKIRMVQPQYATLELKILEIIQKLRCCHCSPWCPRVSKRKHDKGRSCGNRCWY